MLGTVVIGVIFADIKGFPQGVYQPQGRNLGRVEYVHGGVSRNIAENIAASGMPVTFVSMTESGGIGKEVVDRLDASGVNTEFILPVAQNGIGKWMVILDEKGEIAGQMSCPPDMQPLAEFITSYGNAFVRDAEQVILEIDIGEEVAEYVLSLAKKYQKKVYAIVGNLNVLLHRQDLIRKTDCFICNETEIGLLLERDVTALSPNELLEVLRREIPARNYPSTVVTMGEMGSVYIDRKTGMSGWLPAVPTAVADASGAGDAFMAGTVMGLSSGLDLRDAAKMGTQLASITIQVQGGACPKNNLPREFLASSNR